jgi:hypothetical protein
MAIVPVCRFPIPFFDPAGMAVLELPPETHGIQKSSLERDGVGPDTWDRESDED